MHYVLILLPPLRPDYKATSCLRFLLSFHFINHHTRFLLFRSNNTKIPMRRKCSITKEGRSSPHNLTLVTKTIVVCDPPRFTRCSAAAAGPSPASPSPEPAPCAESRRWRSSTAPWHRPTRPASSRRQGAATWALSLADQPMQGRAMMPVQQEPGKGEVAGRRARAGPSPLRCRPVVVAGARERKGKGWIVR